jgi:hypothetical protein
MLLLIQAKYRLYHGQKEQEGQLYDNYTNENRIKTNLILKNISNRVA